MENQHSDKRSEAITGTQVKEYFVTLFKDIFDLDRGVDKETTIEEIISKQGMSGANAWMLICSIMIAAIGLNLDSQAVIIGAMLISPLMSPILGIGLGVAINDRDALYHALLHFGGSIFIALVISTLYFWISPLDEFTPQIQARTEPTFLDILIAVFGGIAGIISHARKDVSTTLPGVAIATALMPPLCVTGYGIANGEWTVAITSFYLFFLNSFFVAFATYVILKRMSFPTKHFSSLKEQRKNMLIIVIFSMAMIIPSIIIFYSVYKKYDRTQSLEEFVNSNFSETELQYLDGVKLIPDDNPNKLLLKVYGDLISEDDIPQYQSSLRDLGLDYIEEIQIISTSDIDLDKIDQMDSQLAGLNEKLQTQLKMIEEERKEQERIKEQLSDYSFLAGNEEAFQQLSKELKILFPDIVDFGKAKTEFHMNKNFYTGIPAVYVEWSDAKDKEEDKFKEFLRARYGLDTLKILNVSSVDF